jgi:bifunctional DNase/RNase
MGFLLSIICERDKIEEIIDARTSDAIALALRFNALSLLIRIS